jgi:hypothetical protein
MRVVITEDIIRNALNESIDEFMVNEGFGDAFKGAWGYAKKAGNWLKNAAAMYMDKQTNGQWNNKYGIYANGNGKTTELYYLNKWFNTHLNNIRQIEYRNNTPSADFSKSREYVERNGERVYTDTEIQEKDIQTYVKKNITPQNFNTWIGNFIKDRQALKLIDDYILKCQKGVTDLQTAMNLLNTGSFLADPETGQVYIKTRNSELGGQRKQYSAKRVENLFNYLNKNPKITRITLQNNVNNLGRKFGVPDNEYEYVKNYIISCLNLLKNNDTIGKSKWLNFTSFMKSNYSNFYK